MGGYDLSVRNACAPVVNVLLSCFKAIFSLWPLIGIVVCTDVHFVTANDEVLVKDACDTRGTSVESLPKTEELPSSKAVKSDLHKGQLIDPVYFHEDSTPLELGVVDVGVELIYRIVIANPYDFKLKYSGFKAGCSCTKLNFDGRTLEQKDSSIATITIKASKEETNQTIKFVLLFYREVGEDGSKALEGYASEHTWIVRTRKACAWSSSKSVVQIGGAEGSQVLVSATNYSNTLWSSPFVEIVSNKLTASTEMADENLDGAMRQVVSVTLNRSNKPAADGFDERIPVKLFSRSLQQPNVSWLIDNTEIQVVQPKIVEIIPKNLFVDRDGIEPIQFFLVSHEPKLNFDSANVELIVNEQKFEIERRRVSNRWISVTFPRSTIQVPGTGGIVNGGTILVTSGDEKYVVDLPFRR